MHTREGMNHNQQLSTGFWKGVRKFLQRSIAKKESTPQLERPRIYYWQIATPRYEEGDPRYMEIDVYQDTETVLFLNDAQHLRERNIFISRYGGGTTGYGWILHRTAARQAKVEQYSFMDIGEEQISVFDMGTPRIITPDTPYPLHVGKLGTVVNIKASPADIIKPERLDPQSKAAFHSTLAAQPPAELDWARQAYKSLSPYLPKLA